MLIAVTITIILIVLAFFWKSSGKEFTQMFGEIRSLDDDMHDQTLLLESGEPAVATVLRASNTGMTANGNPAVRLQVEVRRADREPYTTYVTTVVDRMALPRVQPGSNVDVRVHREHPAQVAIVL